MENDHKVESFEHFNNIKNQEIIMDSANSKTTFHNPTVSSSAAKVVSNNTSPKMGSRRIFTPQFKLQVLESYRNDHDCKGNQRATARKYNIHRRQIQKWLQCETSLRSSVANINQNSVKHQFHNVSMQQQQTKSHAIPSQSYTPTQQQHATHLCLESTKFSTSPNKIYEVASISSCVGLPSAVETQDILDANTVAVVTATSGTIARTNTSENSSAAPVSTLQPPAMISTNRSANAPMTPLLHHHHHHYGIPTYSKMSSSAAVPMLVHHLTSAHQTQYQYHSMHYNPPAISHHQTEKPQISYFTPTLFLPTTATTSNNYIDGNNDYLEKLESFPLGAKTYPKIWSDKGFLYNRAQFRVDYECPNGNRGIDSTNTSESFNINQFKADSSYSTSYPFVPMDLSLRHNKETKSELLTNTNNNLQVHEIPVKKERIGNTVDVVDLTYRKRRSINVLHSTDNYKYECPEKQQKLSDTDANENGLNHLASCSSKSNEDDDIEIEVGTEEKFSPASKPVKLFKPYLLDECDDSHVDNCANRNFNKIEGSEGIDQTVKQADFVNENTFPETVKENIDICAEGSNFLVESRSESPRSACSPATYIPTMSPTNFQYSKGSPASSGYESSTSTYSDTSLSSRKDMYSYGQNYSVTLQMQTLCQESNQVTHPSKQVQSWLEKDDFNSLEINPTAALIG